jgi:steroid 5-alpha reductase family enzyme
MFLSLVFAAVFLVVAMSLAWAVQRRTGNSGWIDTIWSFAVGVAGAGVALTAAGADGPGPRQWLVAALAAIWAVRLGGYIAFRSKGAGEDPRYAWLMQEWGEDASRRLFQFLQAQALAGLILVGAIAVAARDPAPALRPLDLLGALLFLAALAGAALADEQLRRYRAAAVHRGGVCEDGLWAWSRHPNYFFEWLGWCAFPVIALSGGAPIGLLALAAPALMYLLLAHVSGVPPLEAHMERSRGAAFADYRARVNAFFPGPRKSRDSAETGVS